MRNMLKTGWCLLQKSCQLDKIDYLYYYLYYIIILLKGVSNSVLIYILSHYSSTFNSFYLEIVKRSIGQIRMQDFSSSSIRIYSFKLSHNAKNASGRVVFTANVLPIQQDTLLILLFILYNYFIKGSFKLYANLYLYFISLH